MLVAPIGLRLRKKSGSTMQRSTLPIMFATALVASCAASFPPPTQRMADAQSAERSARELGANNQPKSKLSLTLANDQITQAKAAMADGDNKRADGLLIRA